MTTKDILIATRALLSDESRWTQDADARDAYGQPTASPSAPEAVCFCLSGALWKVAADLPWKRDAAWSFLNTRRTDQKRFLTEWNDAPERTHAEVLAFLDEAIEAAP